MSRPVGTGYLKRFDWPLVEEIRVLTDGSTMSLRAAARLVAPRAHNAGYVTVYAISRRLEGYARETFST